MQRKKSLHIGPCWTDNKFRGQGIYPAVLSSICKNNSETNMFIFTEDENIASQKGITKVGFKKFSNGYKSKHFGIYKILNNNI